MSRKLGVMDTAFGRYAFQLLVLLACVVAAWIGEDRTPTREVVETVSVLYKPARVEPAAGGLDNPQSTASPNTSAELVVSPRQVQGQAPAVAQHAKAAARPEPAPPRSPTKPVTAPSEVKQAVKKPTDKRQARKAEPPPPAEPPLPAVFVPVRRLGLYLQARLGVEPEGEEQTSR